MVGGFVDKSAHGDLAHGAVHSLFLVLRIKFKILTRVGKFLLLLSLIHVISSIWNTLPATVLEESYLFLSFSGLNLKASSSEKAILTFD